MNFLMGLVLVLASEEIQKLDRAALVERMKKSYATVSVKLDGDWTVTSPTGTETWTWAQGKWKCQNSQYTCADYIPLSFRWMGQGKGWLNSGQPLERLGFEFKGSSYASAHRHTAKVSSAEDDDTQDQVTFEGKRNAHEVWSWNSNLSADLKVFVSLRDYLIERLDSRDGVEILEWGTRENSKGLILDKVFIERSGNRLLLAKK